MKISSSFNKTDSKNNYQSFKGVPPNPKYLPEGLGKIAKVVGEYVSMPEQKMFLATTALMLQPLIDLKYAEEDKKIDSAIKSASKSIAGGITGVLVRAGFVKLTTSLIGFNKHNRFNMHFMPDKARILRDQDPEIARLQLKQYNQTFGTLLAILFMVLFSNSKIDVPLTSDLQDLISGVVKDNKSWLQSFADVKNKRSAKIKAKIDKITNFCKKVANKIKRIIGVIFEDIPEYKNQKEGRK